MCVLGGGGDGEGGVNLRWTAILEVVLPSPALPGLSLRREAWLRKLTPVPVACARYVRPPNVRCSSSMRTVHVVHVPCCCYCVAMLYSVVPGMRVCLHQTGIVMVRTVQCTVYEQHVQYCESDWGSGKWLAEKQELKSVTKRHALLYVNR